MSSKPSIKWQVSEKETGRYASFRKRSWPTAYYKMPGERIAAMIHCKDSYEPRNLASANHAPLRLYIADHSATPFEWRLIKKAYPSLSEAKTAALRAIEQNPTFVPKLWHLPPPPSTGSMT